MASWAATAEMVARRWSAGDVPTAYARNTLMQGAQQIRSAARKLARAPQPAGPVAQAARERYGQLAARLARIGDAVGKDDRGEVARLSAGLPTIEWQINQLRGRCEVRKQVRAS